MNSPANRHIASQRGASSLELVLFLPFIVLTFLVLVGIGYTLGTKQHALVAARYASTYRVAKGSDPSPASVAHAAFGGGGETWQADIDVDEPPPFIPFMDAFASSGIASTTASSVPERGIIPKLYPAIPAARAKFIITTTTSTCREIGGSSYLTFILNQGGVGGILGTDDEDCCDCYTPD